MLTTEVENFPGFPDAILGPELMEKMEKQAARFEAELLHQEATRVDLGSRPFGVWSGDEEWRVARPNACRAADLRAAECRTCSAPVVLYRVFTNSRLRSSAGQSKSLLMTRSQVRVLPGAPPFPPACSRP